MRYACLSLTGAIFRRRRGFTFLELILAVALSVVLVRGMYVMFSAATSLTQMSEERMVGLFEVSAAFDYLAADFARCPSSEHMSFNTSGQLQFKILGRNDEEPFLLVQYNHDGNALTRSVYTEGGSPYDETGDGQADVGLVVARNVDNFQAEHHVSGSLENATWSSGTSDNTRAVRIQLGFDKVTQHGALGRQDYTLIFPVMSN